MTWFPSSIQPLAITKVAIGSSVFCVQDARRSYRAGFLRQRVGSVCLDARLISDRSTFLETSVVTS
jgi:hypothetical protein